MTVYRHQPVLLHEVLQVLQEQVNSEGAVRVLVDATFGRGGHSSAILERFPDIRIVALDRDLEAVDYGEQVLGGHEGFSIHHSNFTQMKIVLEEQGIGKVDAVLMDLGVSSPQLDDASRGFSFQHEGQLDMRMDSTDGETALTYMQGLSTQQLTQVLREYGEERHAGRIAREIKSALDADGLNTTLDLANLVEKVLGRKERKHPATRTFQAIRMGVNREMDSLKDGLNAALNVLKTQGILVVISFHSIEDRIVKQFFKPQRDSLLSRLPISETEASRLKLEEKNFSKVSRPIKAKDEELRRNPRARSAVLRFGVKR